MCQRIELVKFIHRERESKSNQIIKLDHFQTAQQLDLQRWIPVEILCSLQASNLRVSFKQ